MASFRSGQEINLARFFIYPKQEEKSNAESNFSDVSEGLVFAAFPFLLCLF